MAGPKVKLKDQLGRVVRLGGDSTGATVGKDLRWPDGSLVKSAEIRNPSTDAGGTGPVTTVWKLIREVPANLQKLAKLAGIGFVTRDADGEWHQRSLVAGEGVQVNDGDGVAGDPVVGLAELPDAGGGTLQKTARDSYGRLAGTSAADTSDLPEGSNLYFTDGRADARAAAAVAAHEAKLDPHPQYQRALPAGTAGQFLRGDGAWSNQLQGPIVLGRESWGLGFTATLLHEFQDSEGVPCEAMVRYNAGSTGPFVLGMKARGDRAAPAGAQAGDRLMSVRGGGWQSGGAWAANQAVELLLVASEDFTPSANGTRYVFRATPLGQTSAVNAFELDTLHNLHPGANATQSCGTSARRWSTVYAATGTINTSDAREKTPVRPLSQAELAAAAELASQIGSYQWLDMIEAKGQGARQHIGMTVQGAIAILESHGLDPFAYGFICHDRWDELPEIRHEWPALPQVVDDFGNIVQEALEAGFEIEQEYRPAGDRYSFRMDELLAFIAAGQQARILAIEQQLASLTGGQGNS